MDEDSPMRCSMCDGKLMLLGQLGERVHFRCKNCGMDISRPMKRTEFKSKPLHSMLCADQDDGKCDCLGKEVNL